MTPTQLRRTALRAMIALAAASSLVLLNEIHVAPTWVQWGVSLVALAAALGVLVIADLSWQVAVANAEADGLVTPPAADGANDPPLARMEP
jgi:hypothetical protein